jgi:hypothetical protein
MVTALLSIVLQKDRSQSLQSRLVAYLAKGVALEGMCEEILETIHQYEALLVAVERKRYKFPMRWSDRVILARFSRSAKNELDGRSLRYNANYIELRNRCTKKVADPTP